MSVPLLCPSPLTCHCFKLSVAGRESRLSTGRIPWISNSPLSQWKIDTALMCLLLPGVSHSQQSQWGAVADALWPSDDHASIAITSLLIAEVMEHVAPASPQQLLVPVLSGTMPAQGVGSSTIGSPSSLPIDNGSSYQTSMPDALETGPRDSATVSQRHCLLDDREATQCGRREVVLPHS
jgi:hypothetical protein